MAAQQFEKHLTPHEITRKFSVPTAWLDAMPEFGEGRQEVLLRAVDGVGFGWQFICAVRKGRYKKPVLNLAQQLWFTDEDWEDPEIREAWYMPKPLTHFFWYLTSAKSLKAGDKIIFYEEENEVRGSQYRFRAQKLDAYGNWVDV